jgi:hypothetical protein
MQPKIRTASKYPEPWPLNKFPEKFARNLGAEIIARLAVDHTGSIEGETWEQMFAVALGANWKPSNVGLDDVVLGDCAWGAKTVKSGDPFKTTHERLISGRNDPRYSYGYRPRKAPALGKMVLGIWNQRVDEVKKNYRHVRTVVLVKPNQLVEEWLDFVVFEFDTVPFNPKEFDWSWNKNKNLLGHRRGTEDHCFTWQPHGAQFTIIHDVPEERLRFQVRKPPSVETGVVLKAVKFDESWVRICAPT